MHIKEMIHSLRTVHLQAGYATVIIASFCWTIVSKDIRDLLDSKMSMTTSMRFDLKLSKNRLHGKLHFTIFHQKS